MASAGNDDADGWATAAHFTAKAQDGQHPRLASALAATMAEA